MTTPSLRLMTFGLFVGLNAFVDVSLAQTCTSVETANIQNWYTCPPEVIEQIFYQVARKVTPDDIGDRVFISDVDTYPKETNISYITGKDGQFCRTYVMTNSLGWSASEKGVLGHITYGCKSLQSEPGSHFERLKVWQGEIFSVNYDSISILRPQYPMKVEDAQKIIDDSKAPSWKKTDALVSLVKDLRDSDKATVMMDFLYDPIIRSSKDLYGVFDVFTGLHDKRTYQVLMSVLRDSLVSEDVVAEILKVAYREDLVGPELFHYVRAKLKLQDCGGKSNGGLVLFAAYPESGLGKDVSALLSSCSPIDSNSYRLWFTPALEIIGEHRIMSGVLPTVALLENYAERSTRECNEGFRTMLITAINTLSSLRSELGLAVLKSDFYFNNPMYPEISTAARTAVKNIEAGIQIKNILKGDQSAVAWGYEAIHYYKATERVIRMEILDAYETVMVKFPKLKKEIQDFIKNEVESGRHKHDRELVEKLKSLLRI